jgi:hypothetical protein
MMVEFMTVMVEAQHAQKK